MLKKVTSFARRQICQSSFLNITSNRTLNQRNCENSLSHSKSDVHDDEEFNEPVDCIIHS